MDRAADPYLQPNGTLKNKLGITDPEELSLVEDQMVSLRQAMLVRRGFSFPFTVDTIREIHRFLFQDIYDWAGEFRLCNISKSDFEDSNTIIEFAPFWTIEKQCKALLAGLTKVSFLHGLTHDAFCRAAADFFSQLNAIHPFREGNGRTQRIFFALLARGVGRDLAFDVITKERMVAVSIKSHGGERQAMTRLFHEISDSDRIRPLRGLIGFLKRQGYSWNDIYIATTVAGQHYRGVLAGVSKPDFMLRVADLERGWIASGHTDDLPDDVLPQQEVSFTASRF